VSDVLIRDIPDEVLVAIDARAAKLGISRVEYVRRRLAQDAATSSVPVTIADLQRFGDDFADLSDPEVMAGAWD
jgi:plasmid stability protein